MAGTTVEEPVLRNQCIQPAETHPYTPKVAQGGGTSNYAFIVLDAEIVSRNSNNPSGGDDSENGKTVDA